MAKLLSSCPRGLKVILPIVLIIVLTVGVVLPMSAEQSSPDIAAPQNPPYPQAGAECPPAAYPWMLPSAAQARQDLFESAGTQAYIYGLPIVEMYRNLWEMSLDQSSSRFTPLNVLRQNIGLPGEQYADITVPNDDTVYGYAWLYLDKKEPLVIHVPEVTDRYYSLMLNDFYSDVINYIGVRTTGTQEGYFLVVGPDWNGSVPDGFLDPGNQALLKSKVKAQKDGNLWVINKDGINYGILQSPTPFTWVYSRVRFVGTEEDYNIVAPLLQQIEIFPLDRLGNGGADGYEGLILEDMPPVNYGNSSEAQQEAPQYGVDFYRFLQLSLQLNPPKDVDGSMMDILAQIYAHPDQCEFDPASLNPLEVAALETATVKANNIIHNAVRYTLASFVNRDWATASLIGHWGTHFYHKAGVTSTGPGAHIRKEAVYYHGPGSPYNPLIGQYQYTMTFPAQPPSNNPGFWSMSVYESATDQFVEGVERHSIGTKNLSELNVNPDGSFTIYLQATPPEDSLQLQNWLPLPQQGRFYSVFRVYLPTDEVVNSQWVPPLIQRVTP